jgi:hypothetical protein
MIKAIFYATKGTFKDKETERGTYQSEADVRLRALALNWRYEIVE